MSENIRCWKISLIFSAILYFPTSDIFWHLIFSAIWYFPTSDIFWHLIFSVILYFLSSYIFRHLRKYQMPKNIRCRMHYYFQETVSISLYALYTVAYSIDYRQ
jgi:hypothetical protein